MLQLIEIAKAYKTAGFTQIALDHVSLSFRDSEFVAVLGPSGSGKTTMLNVLGGLDHADSGDIVINGVSTQHYSDKDWDTYRNHRIGFIFQSYNLIPHQTVLANVELALTLAGVPRGERRDRCIAALERVGLGEHINKRPNQLSGGQMQRVAIARALVNDPDIVLADEPTGALDTETGVQVMNLLKEIADERLIVMVTHNPELAEEYATRIVRLADGRIVSDTDPFDPLDDSAAEPAPEPESGPEPQDVPPQAGASGAPAAAAAEAEPRATATKRIDKGDRRASMSFFTALTLSFNNLMTKKGRTFMTAFAGSIGIIGIAAILSLSNGVNAYIADTEEEALSSYPLTITKSSFDITNLMMVGAAISSNPGASGASAEGAAAPQDARERILPQNSIMEDMFAQVKNNDLSAFKSFLESGESGIEPYINHIQYSYGITPLIYKADTSEDIVKLNPSYMASTLTNGIMGSALTGGTSMTSFSELMDNERLLHQQMELVAGEWPDSYDECVVVLNRSGGLSDYSLYSLGFYDTKAMEDMTAKALSGEEVVVPRVHRDFTVGEALDLRFKVVPTSTLYQKNDEQGTWTDMSSDKDYMRKAIEEGIELKVVGVIQRAEGSSASGLTEGVAYTPELTRQLMKMAQGARVVQEQRDKPSVDVFTGKTFEELIDAQAHDFDLSSMFKIDEEKISEAFSFDTSALSDMGSDFDLSGIDMSSFAGGFEGFDFSQLNLDVSSLSSMLDPNALMQIMAGAPAFELGDGDLLSTFGQLGEQERIALTSVTDQLTTDFMSWYMAPREAGGYGGSLADLQGVGMAEAFVLFLQTPEAQAIVEPLGQGFAFEAEQAIGLAMNDYLVNSLGPYLSNAIGELVSQAAQAMAAQMAGEIQTQMTAVTEQFGSQLSSTIASQLSAQMEGIASKMEEAFAFDADVFAEAIQFNMTQEDLASLLTNYMNAEELSFDNNLKKLGYATEEKPESISIYPVDFPAKESVLEVIDAYNERMEAEGKDDHVIQYSDFAGALMGSVTDIVNTISLVLIAFVSISLVVSSIMISIITYISVLERKKEIGILRAMGASKLNVANVFNAETVIEGFLAGMFAIMVVYVASVPVNAFIYETRQVPNIMQLPARSAAILVGISVVLTLVAGIIPSSAAARRDPVEALRSE